MMFHVLKELFEKRGVKILVRSHAYGNFSEIFLFGEIDYADTDLIAYQHKPVADLWAFMILPAYLYDYYRQRGFGGAELHYVYSGDQPFYNDKPKPGELPMQALPGGESQNDGDSGNPEHRRIGTTDG